jgi:hypothetical protein
MVPDLTIPTGELFRACIDNLVSEFQLTFFHKRFGASSFRQLAIFSINTFRQGKVLG